MLRWWILLGLLVSSAAGDEKDRLLPPPKHGNVYVIAHRGAHLEIPENTLAAYRRAIDLGCDFVEIDLRTTADGAIVSVHNKTVDEYTKDAKGFVKDLTLVQLKSLDIGNRIDPKWKDERIPTFREILELCKDKIGIYVDIKDVDVVLAVKLVQEFQMEHRCVWYGSPAHLERVKMASTNCRLMPDPGPEMNLAKVLETWQPKVVASMKQYCSQDFVQRCHLAGAIIFVDDKSPNDWEQFLSWGVDGIQTDHPQKLIEMLKQRN